MLTQKTRVKNGWRHNSAKEGTQEWHLHSKGPPSPEQIVRSDFCKSGFSVNSLNVNAGSIFSLEVFNEYPRITSTDWRHLHVGDSVSGSLQKSNSESEDRLKNDDGKSLTSLATHPDPQATSRTTASSGVPEKFSNRKFTARCGAL